MGSYLSIENNTQDEWMCRIGPDEAAANIAKIATTFVAAAGFMIATAGAGGATVGLAPLVISGAAIESTSSLLITQGMTEELKKEGYETIAVGQKHQWGKMTLSLWQQGTCIRTERTGDKTATVHTLYMRPIFSGATDNSELTHQIQWWIDKWGTEKQNIVIESPSTPPPTMAPTPVTEAPQPPSPEPEPGTIDPPYYPSEEEETEELSTEPTATEDQAAEEQIPETAEFSESETTAEGEQVSEETLETEGEVESENAEA